MIPVRRADLGFLRDGLDIITTDVEMPLKRISVVATIEEYFEVRSAYRGDSVIILNWNYLMKI